MKLTLLNIRYDPEYPYDWATEADYWDKLYPPRPPRFPYSGNTVSVFGLQFYHRHVNTRGFDPYAGEEWTCEVGQFNLALSSVITWSVELNWRSRSLLRTVEDCGKLPWHWSKLWHFLEYRREWWERRTCVEEDYDFTGYE